MATIQLILNAVNNASKTFDAVAASATEAANRVDDLNAKIDVTSAALEGQAAAAGRAADQLDKLAASAAAAASAQKANAAATVASGSAARVAYGWWGLLFGRVALFGGMATISGLHLALDVLAEILAVVIPAGVALGAFGVAASDAVSNVIRHFTSLHTVMDATGQAIPPMTGALEKLHDAVQPDVYQVLGDALLVANSRMGELEKLAMGTGTVLDQLAARASVALESSGVSKFLGNAIPDVAKLGDVVGNIFGTVGNLLKSMPGYAEVLLSILDGVTRALEAVTGSGFVQGVLRIGLAFHGAVVYMGLAATAVLALQGPLGRLATMLIVGAQNVAIWGASTAIAASKGGILAGAMEALSVVPVWGWVAIGAAALAGLIFWLVNAKTATQKWLDQMQAGIASQQTWSGLVQALGADQSQVAQQLASTTKQLAATQEFMTAANGRSAEGIRGVSYEYRNLQQTQQQLKAGAQQLSAEQQLSVTRLAALGKQVGGTSVALGLMTQAHVKAGDAAKASASAWAQDVQQVLALQAGLRAMADYAAGNATTSLEVLDNQASDQYKAIQQVNAAWDTFTTNMTSTQGSFDTVAQGYTTLGESAGSFKTYLGKLVLNLKFTQTAIDSLTPAGIALNQAFTEQVGNVSKLYDSWRTAGIASDLFTAGVKASIVPLLKYAKGSQEATDQLVGLAEQAGYQGPASMKSLVQWLGSTHGATQKLKDVTDQATQQEALLSGAMRSQGNMISGQLIGDINQAILKYDGVAQAASAYGKAVAQDGRDSAAAHSARQTLINDLILSGKAAGDSAGQIAGMIAKVLGIPTKRALQIVMSGTGSYSVTAAGLARTLVNAQHARANAAASGMYVSRGRRGVDDQLILAQRGELVVPTHLVKAGEVDHLRGRIPGFASGGLVNAGNTSVLTGQYAVSSYDKFTKTLTDAVASALRQALASSAGGVSGNVASYANAARTALAMLGQPLTDVSVVLRQMSTESGGNPYAVNRSDSNWAAGTPSVGLMQVIGPTFARWAGPFRNTGPFLYGVSTNPLANIYAGLDYAVHSYPDWTSVLGQGHGYASGGIVADTGTVLSPGWNVRYNGTGGPEPLVPAGARGVAINIAEMNVRHESDVGLVAQRLSGMIRAASLGGGWRG